MNLVETIRLVIAGALILLLNISTSAQHGSIVHSVFLVGDCGEPSINKQPLGGFLNKQIDASPAKTTVLYLGDNVYPKGMPSREASDRKRAEDILASQLAWSRNADHAFVIPGNHDWKRGKSEGFRYIINQQDFVDSLKKRNASFSPRGGCPGPVVVDLSDSVVLIIIDTQWPLQGGERGGIKNECSADNNENFWKVLSDTYAAHAHQRIILAGHHPMISYGEHGGKFTIMDHLFPLLIVNPKLYIPLPIVGSIYPLYRKWFGHVQDIRHPKYRQMSKNIRHIMATYPGSIGVAGHEHALEFIEQGKSTFIVSGSGSKSTHVKKRGHAKFAKSRQGFARMDLYINGDINVTFYQVDKTFPEGSVVYEQRAVR